MIVITPLQWKPVTITPIQNDQKPWITSFLVLFNFTFIQLSTHFSTRLKPIFFKRTIVIFEPMQNSIVKEISVEIKMFDEQKIFVLVFFRMQP